jgi:hypothetical protein
LGWSARIIVLIWGRGQALIPNIRIIGFAGGNDPNEFAGQIVGLARMIFKSGLDCDGSGWWIDDEAAARPAPNLMPLDCNESRLRPLWEFLIRQVKPWIGWLQIGLTWTYRATVLNMHFSQMILETTMTKSKTPDEKKRTPDELADTQLDNVSAGFDGILTLEGIKGESTDSGRPPMPPAIPGHE